MLDNVMQKRGAFFGLLSSHADRMVGGANATLRLISGLDNPRQDNATLIEEVNVIENSADEIKAAFIKLLFESFNTPGSREQLHSLILDLDRVLDTLQSVANAVAMYSIVNSTVEARAMASLGADACLRLNRAVAALANRNRGVDIVQFCREVEELESQAGKAMRQGVSKLFEREGDEQAVWQAIKMRRLYFAQAAVLDGCKRAAKTIEEIVMESG